VLGPTQDFIPLGAERSSLKGVVEAVARDMKLRVSADARPEQGSFYRSDHFSFAHAGIPSFSIHESNEFAGKPANYGAEVFQEFNEKHYHQPSDEYKDSWDFSGLEEMAKFGLTLGIDAANMRAMPTWNRGDEFLPAREKSLGSR